MTIRTYVEIPVEVEFDYHSGEPQTSDCPGSDESVEITLVSACHDTSEKVPLVDITQILTKKQLDELEDDALEEVAELRKEHHDPAD